MALFDAFGYYGDSRYLKPIMLAFFGTLSLAKNGQLGFFGVLTKVMGSGSGYPITYS